MIDVECVNSVSNRSKDIISFIIKVCRWFFFNNKIFTFLDLSTFKELIDKQQPAPNDTAYKRWSCHSRLKLLCKLCQTSPPPAIGARFTVLGHAGHADPLMLTKAGDVETNPGPTTLHKKVWICDICHKQIHVRKQISIRCNRIEHWVHLRCAGIRQAQYTDTWTCHLHR